MGQNQTSDAQTNSTIKTIKPIFQKNRNAFLQYAAIQDNIEPIYESNQQDGEFRHDDSDDTSLRSYNLRKALEGNKSRIDSSDGSFKSKLSIDSKLLKSLSSDSDSLSLNGDVRGLYHHEVSHKRTDELSIYFGIAHPIVIEGNCSVGKTLKVKDMSQWQNQYPLIKVQWYLGTELGSQTKFQIIPISKSRTLELIPGYIGRYIQAEGIREIEKQIQDPTVDKGIFDPHIHKVMDAKTGLERQFVPVKSNVMIGPTLISDLWAYRFMECLIAGQFSCTVDLIDNSAETGLKTNNAPNDSFLMIKVPGTLIVTFKSLVISCKKKYIEHLSTSSFPFPIWEWVKNVLGIHFEDITTGVVHSKDINAQFRLKSVRPRPSSIDSILVLDTLNHKTKKSVKICLSLEEDNQRDFCLYQIILFQAARLYRQISADDWRERSNIGDFDFIKSMLQQYLEYLVTRVTQDVPAYEVDDTKL